MSPNIIPDPTTDLSWDSWHGAIHEVFAHNATQFPDRLCVTETTPLRQFTYRQINEASNVLAHHFVQSGISRGNVIMIYAFRNVDLMIAIMGTLKSGATFSVLDPAYPPDRQIVYLDVSRPRGLVVIGKAQGGGLSKTVSDWISQTLDLKTFVPSLQLQDDGRISGGKISESDVLDAAQPSGRDLPDVVVGPDSNPTLSFTSGSEGKPKGVLGRHFSLVYYQTWMARKFGLSQNDRFTMLSGISHDPIQRDIFTTLFLGAQIMIPSSEDIQHEKLAEWMREWRCTVTHLTPAMGQILVGGAKTQFPELKSAFLVGDVLIKRDVRRLQELAPNCKAINMFGTTETQRAVSYFLVPNRTEDANFLDKVGDRIPAGKGMHDVQLLVVDRQNPNRICDIGEQGEIYVRASGLAEGYLGLGEYTKEKFITNWFVSSEHWISKEEQKLKSSGFLEPWRQCYKGPRDRLYRSGDLGHYTSAGDVECTGRADNQVKIRGFRIELGEIDSFLSQHQVVRENVTLVRRDENEEHTLVSYIVPELRNWPQWLEGMGCSDQDEGKSMVGMLRKFSTLRDDLRKHLKSKLPVYAVPSVIIPLDRMPLNPNGKVDRPALPFPTAEELRAAQPARDGTNTEQLTQSEKDLAAIWSEVLRIPAEAISAEDSFFDLGAHSLSAQRMLFQVRKKHGNIDVLLKSIYDYPTLRGFASEIDRAKDPTGRVLQFDKLTAEKHLGRAEHYSKDAKDLIAQLPLRFRSSNLENSKRLTVFLTGATGFLGSFVMANLLSRSDIDVRLIAHVRDSDHDRAHARLLNTCKAYGLWSDTWSSRLEIVTGDLEKDRLGISEQKWETLKEDVDIIIANGAKVHWVSPYQSLRAANVLATLSLIGLAAEGKPKQMTFISSTSVLGTDHYVQLSEKMVQSGGAGVPEDDDLSGSERGLDTGYGQSKWSSEYLMREAGRRGLVGSIVRPGYVMGDSERGMSVTDDFLIRMLIGCMQLRCRPNIPNSINMVPVDHVAAVVVASAMHPPVSPLGVTQVTPHPRLTFNRFLACLEMYGYKAPQVEYDRWREALEEYISRHDSHALLPLLHIVLADLPSQTKGVELDDRNAVTSLSSDFKMAKEEDILARSAVTENNVGKYLSFLVAISFLEAPSGKTLDTLPSAHIDEAQMIALKKMQGRSALQ